MELPHAPHRLLLDGEALVSNWRWLRERGGSAACGACVKADGYGLGAAEVARRLAAAGCRDLYVSTWAEAAALPRLPDVSAAVFHGVQPGEEAFAAAHWARPVLNSVEQIARWRGTGRPCDVMVDTGMNRLGISVAEARSGLLDGLQLDTLMSHLASADGDSRTTERQRMAFESLRGRTPALRMSLANSAGVALGEPYAFDLTRPGLALYGGRPRAGMDAIRPVHTLEARVVQRRTVRAGETVGYNELWRAPVDTPVAVVNLGYADGLPRDLTNVGLATDGRGARLVCVGRVSMDLTCLRSAEDQCVPVQGEWVRFPIDLPAASRRSGRSQYELLTGLGSRLDCRWIG